MRVHEPAICLRTTDYSETSQVVHFLTRDSGVVHLIAKGAKRPKSKTGGALDVLAEGQVVFSSKGAGQLGTLMEFTETAIHTPLRRDVGKLYAALYMIEIIGGMFAQGDPHPEVFDLLSRTLARLDQADAPPQAVLAYFQWRLLGSAGLLGDLSACVVCGRSLAGERGLQFSSQLGGIVCRDCEPAAPDRYELDAGALEGLSVLATVRQGERRRFPAEQARAVNRLLAYHAQQQLGRGLKTARYAIG